MNGSTLIQGGRLRKTSRGIISFAPFLAGASVLALGALLATSSPVEAGSCSETGTTGMWTCTGAASGSNNDIQAPIRGRANQNVVVTGEAGFGFAGDGIKIDGITNSGTIDVNFTNSNNISSIFTGIDIYQPGTGAVTVATNGTIESSGYDGIEISQYGNGDVTVTTDGAVTGNLSGIEIFSTSGITGDVNLTTNAAVTGDAEGIKLDVKGNSAVTVIATGTVTSSSTEEAIEIKHSGTGDVNLTTSDTVTATVASKDAIRVNHTGTGNITLTVNGSVVGGSSANAIDLSTASTSSNATIILGSGASFTGGIDVSGVMGDASIEVGGTGDRSFDIGDTPAITGDHNFDKNGDHTLTLTGTHASSAAFEQTNINAGKLVWGGTDFRTTSLTIANGAALEITGSGSFTDITGFTVSNGGTLEITGSGSFTDITSFTVSDGGILEITGSGSFTDITSFTVSDGGILEITGSGTFTDTTGFTVANGGMLEITGSGTFTNTPVTLSGRLMLTGNGSNITVQSLTGNNDSDIDIDVDFSGGDAELTSARLTATSVTGTIPVNIRAVMGGFPEIPEDDEDGAITLENFLDVGDSDAFVAGDVLDNGNFNFDLIYDAANSRWNLVAGPGQNGGGIEEALYESLPSALTQLASLESYQQRLQGRQHGEKGGVWAKVSSSSNEFEPVSATLATYEIKDATAEFGIDVPLRINHPYIFDNFSVGASVAFGDATTDVAIEDNTGEIETGTVKAIIFANWEHDGVYLDGQLQYATFNNDVATDTKLGSVNATAYSGGLEAGYGMDVGGLRVIPSAQLLWTSVDFEDFTDSNGVKIVLDDGVVVSGRAGIGLEYDWRGTLYGGAPSGDVFLRGRADVLVPVDGDVNTRINDTEFTSEREYPSFDIGIGATYAWDETYALSADISTQQGEEIEGYVGSIGFKYKF